MSGSPLPRTGRSRDIAPGKYLLDQTRPIFVLGIWVGCGRVYLMGPDSSTAAVGYESHKDRESKRGRKAQSKYQQSLLEFNFNIQGHSATK